MRRKLVSAVCLSALLSFDYAAAEESPQAAPTPAPASESAPSTTMKPNLTANCLSEIQKVREEIKNDIGEYGKQSKRRAEKYLRTAEIHLKRGNEVRCIKVVHKAKTALESNPRKRRP